MAAPELRISPDGCIAQHALVPGRYGTDHEVWVGFTWPDGLLTVRRYTDDEVADWQPIDIILEVHPTYSRCVRAGHVGLNQPHIVDPAQPPAAGDVLDR